MRNPDRNNYEIWIIDWIEGNLGEAEEARLMAFLEKNPDIKEEADLLLKTRITAVDLQMSNKELLKKDIADLDMSQIDLLSVSYLENDISAEQSAELQKCIETNSEAKERFSRIQKLKLKPTGEQFKNKRSLKRIGLPGKISRIVTVTAAAAAILIFVLLYPISLREPKVQETFLSENQDTNVPPAAPSEALKTIGAPTTTAEIDEATDNESSEVLSKMVAEAETEPLANVRTEIISDTYIVYEYGIPPIEIDLGQTLAANIMAAESGNLRQSYTAKPKMDYPYDERGPVEKLVVRLFRKKVLNEEIPSNYPIRGYEYAEAWIATLNKVWETEMALTKNTNEDGEVESVNFTAGLIKFNAKVRNYGEGL
ncbi:MAG: hypothetical protein ACOX5K_05055 [Bacteroidales bacterium]